MTLVPRRVKRWWRSRGHGVHSPFAFRFITMVLRGRGVYYASSELSAMPDARWHRLLFRLVCELEPTGVSARALTAHELRAVALADSRVRVVDEADGADKPDGPNKPNRANKPDICMRLSAGDVMIVRDIAAEAECWRGLCDGLSAGMTFTNGRIGIAVSRPDLPRQDFEIDF